MILQKHILTFIATHGITDIFLPIHLWFPIYTISFICLFIPMKLLNCITLLLSVIHFYQDNIFTYHQIIFGLCILLYYGDYLLSQILILFYLCIIHIPIHYYHFTFTHIQYIFLILTYIVIYYLQFIQDTLIIIIKSGGKLPNNYIHKLLLLIINSHVITNTIHFYDK
jgi:hypothetical protein